MTQKMEGGQTPIQTVQSQVFGEPVLQLVFSLRVASAQAVDLIVRLGQTHFVETLDVADVLVDIETHLSWHVGHAAAARARYQGHCSCLEFGVGR